LKTKKRPVTQKQIVTVWVYRKHGESNTLIANRLKCSMSRVHYIVKLLLDAGAIDPYPRRWGFKQGTDYQKYTK
jgi:predicted transcriptional regulator